MTIHIPVLAVGVIIGFTVTILVEVAIGIYIDNKEKKLKEEKLRKTFSVSFDDTTDEEMGAE